jgi:multidrug efflux pump subunit AcrB
MLLGVVFIYIVLASQFESFIHPITIMMALPLAMIGAFVAVFVTGWSMSMGISIGIILLMGLVTKNGILLVDHAVVATREGKSPKEAILEAGAARLRPILMTSAAMVLGMLPTALSDGSGSEFRGPMAVGIIGGVISSTFLTLLVTPVLFLAMERLRHLFGTQGKDVVRPQRAPEAELSAHAAE